MRRVLPLACAAFLLAAAGPESRPVKEIAPARLSVAPGAEIPLYASADLGQKQPGITRAIVIFHGLLRNAEVYYQDGLKTLQAGGAGLDTTLLLAPQFLADVDLAPHALSGTTLAWGRDAWAGGEPARKPAPISSYQAIDALLLHLADRDRYPALRKVVLAGHSAGAQMVQRYAVVGRAEDSLRAAGIAVSYVIANPSSYLYFTPERPMPVNTAGCSDWNDWKYGMAGGLVPYVQGDPTALEKRYAGRNVTYLLGTADIDPNHRLLDKSCAGEAQGPYRLARGHAYFAMLQARDGAILRQRLFEVPGVPHSEARMFQSACGLAAILGASASGAKACPDGQ